MLRLLSRTDRPEPILRSIPLLLVAAMGLAGCASPGPPRPPSLRIPSPATGLRAERSGQQVILTFTTPSESTDGQTLRGITTAAVCRNSQPAAGQPCNRVLSVPVIAGAPASVSDSLPAGLLTGAPALLTYRIQLLNAAGRAAPPSAPAFTASGAAPSPIGPLTIAATRQGALITWIQSSDASPVELRRTLVEEAPHPTGKALPSTKTTSPEPLRKPRKDADSVILRAESGTDRNLPEEAGGRDAGGLRDPGVQPLARYRYTAQRVRTVTFPEPVAGKRSSNTPAGELTIELRGLPSPDTPFTFRDVFPPRAPSGVAAIASPGDASLTPAIPASIDLSWEAGPEPDLLGYNVYRAEAGLETFHRVNAVPLPGPAFRDLGVIPGDAYAYRVTAVDRTGNESVPSSSLLEKVPRP